MYDRTEKNNLPVGNIKESLVKEFSAQIEQQVKWNNCFSEQYQYQGF